YKGFFECSMNESGRVGAFFGTSSRHFSRRPSSAALESCAKDGDDTRLVNGAERRLGGVVIADVDRDMAGEAVAASGVESGIIGRAVALAPADIGAEGRAREQSDRGAGFRVKRFAGAAEIVGAVGDADPRSHRSHAAR